MSTTEALKIRVDNLLLENQQLTIENARLRESHPQEAAQTDAIAERDQLAGEKQRIDAKHQQLRAVYDQLVCDSQEDQRVLETFREQLERETAQKQRLSTRCRELEAEVMQVNEAAELEQYRAVQREREKWEEREERLLQQLRELQQRVECAGRMPRDDLSYSYCGEEDSQAGDSYGGAARTRVTFSADELPARPVVSGYPLIPLSPTTEAPPQSGLVGELASGVRGLSTNANYQQPRLAEHGAIWSSAAMPGMGGSVWPGGGGVMSTGLGGAVGTTGGCLSSMGSVAVAGSVPGMLRGSARGTGGESVMGDRSGSVTLTGATCGGLGGALSTGWGTTLTGAGMGGGMAVEAGRVTGADRECVSTTGATVGSACVSVSSVAMGGGVTVGAGTASTGMVSAGTVSPACVSSLGRVREQPW